MIEPWIQVERLDGSTGKLGLLALFKDAHNLRGISGELPQMQFATLRLCEAIMYRAFGAPGTSEEEARDLWRELWELGRFPSEEISAYLDEYRDGFDLFGEKPFYQVRGLVYAAAEPSSISSLMPDIPKQDKALFAMRSIRYADSLSFDEAARYLLIEQGYDTSGIKTPVEGNTHVNKGKVYPPKGLPGTGWCGSIGGTFVEGRNLFETIMLNWVLADDRGGERGLFGIEEDCPPWERDDIGPDMKECEPAGPVQVLTWQNRRIRLIPNGDGTCVKGVVLCYGDTMKPIDKQGLEMMTPWRRSEQQQKKWSLPYIPLMAKKHDPNRSIWRGLSSLVAIDNEDVAGQSDLRPGVIRWIESLESAGVLDGNQVMSIRAQGMEYGTQDSVFTDSVDDSLSLHAMMLRHDGEATSKTVEVIAQTDQAVGALIRFVQNILIAQGDRRRYTAMGDSVAGAVRQDISTRAYDELDALFRSRIARFTPQQDVYDYCASWLREAHRILLGIGESYLAESDVSLFSGGQMPAGRALELFRFSLNKLLGPLTATSESESARIVEK